MARQKTKEELDEHYNSMNLEKGDLPAMLIAALITIGPVVAVIIFLMLILPYILLG